VQGKRGVEGGRGVDVRERKYGWWEKKKRRGKHVCALDMWWAFGKAWRSVPVIECTLLK